MTAKLAFRGVSAGYDAQLTLRDFDLEVHAGEVVGLVGPNGAGKSTALRVASGLLKPRSGAVELEGRPLQSWRRAELARQLTIVQQSQVTPPLIRVRDYVALGRTPHIGFFANETLHDWAAVDQAMATAGVFDLAQRRLDELSGGERQRAIVARALAQQPAVLLLDEPTSNLDLKYQQVVLSLALDLAREREVACLAVLHDITLAARFCDRMCLLAAGRRIAFGPPAEVLQPEQLSRVYETDLEVLTHPSSGRPVVVHAYSDAGRPRDAAE